MAIEYCETTCVHCERTTAFQIKNREEAVLKIKQLEREKLIAVLQKDIEDFKKFSPNPTQQRFIAHLEGLQYKMLQLPWS
jgi:wyosine [tRNA(Phe)-imidazoG37] synthetase (radical SAM superfamily)